uniref:Uncharacterized protein n=1 Tax=viral metagenome TaxID=1070528 RepID=A0A6H1ZEV0_9ZZZZ
MKKKVVKCPDCGKKVKNLGSHKRFCPARQQVETETVNDDVQQPVVSAIQETQTKVETITRPVAGTPTPFEGVKIRTTQNYVPEMPDDPKTAEILRKVIKMLVPSFPDERLKRQSIARIERFLTPLPPSLQMEMEARFKDISP